MTTTNSVPPADAIGRSLRLAAGALVVLGAADGIAAQSQSWLFGTSQTETTQSGSGGTVLQTLRPNEVVRLEHFPCPVLSAEKWGPTTCYQTMAGDADNNGDYYDPSLFGSIDALLDFPNPVLGCPSQRTVFWSPSQALPTFVSGLPGMRPGDTARIVRVGVNEGQVEHFLRVEDLQLAMGMTTTPVVDLDAIAADPAYGVFFSLDATHTVNTTCGVTTVQDGDLLVIPASCITWTPDLRVASVIPGCAEVIYTEAQMDAMVANAQIQDRFGTCLTQIVDLEALDIDYTGPVSAVVSCPGTAIFVPTFVFSGESMTGAGLCSTQAGGIIHVGSCRVMGSPCGTATPTLGDQMGLLPPSGTLGVPSYVNALTATPTHLYVLEPKVHQFTGPAPIWIDVNAPNLLNVVYVTIAPPVVPASWTFTFCGFPDVYIVPWIWWTPVPQGFSTITTPPVTGPVKLVWQGVTLDPNFGLLLSTPALVDVN
ncbi:MAG: hypothetical protein AB7I19_13855 [Planctomycetota bacterium]